MVREHFVHFAALPLVRWTLFPYSQHFVHLTNENRVKWTKCSLPSHPSMPPLTFPRRRVLPVARALGDVAGPPPGRFLAADQVGVDASGGGQRQREALE